MKSIGYLPAVTAWKTGLTRRDVERVAEVGQVEQAARLHGTAA
jgi:hypothetical protein